MTRTVTCRACGLEFESTWSEEEAMAEGKREFPNTPADKFSVVCDGCYEAIMTGIKDVPPESRRP